MITAPIVALATVAISLAPVTAPATTYRPSEIRSVREDARVSFSYGGTTADFSVGMSSLSTSSWSLTASEVVDRFAFWGGRNSPARQFALERLALMRDLADGWLGEPSEPISKSAIHNAVSGTVLLASVPADFTPAPLPDGGVRFEWTRHGIDYVIELEADGGMYMCALHDDAEDDTDVLLEAWDQDAFLSFVQGGTFA